MTRKERIETIISDHLTPIVMEVLDESHKHHVPKGSESHFKLVIVTDEFQSLSQVMRHRFIHKLLASELKMGLHALSLHLFTSLEWDARQKQMADSPSCRGGAKL